MRSGFLFGLVAAGVAFDAPVDTQSYVPAAKVPAIQGSEIPNFTVEKRDGRWPWQKEQNVIGKYPDGRLKCRIPSTTAGNTEGPCPPVLPPEEIAKLLHAELCKRPGNCCKENGDPCGDP